MSLWYEAHLTTYLDLNSCKILRSGFDFMSNLTSAIGSLANLGFLASYVSRHTAMAYDKEPESTRNATKRVVEILDAQYDKADLPSIVKNNCAHLSMPHQNLLLALLLKYKELFDGMLRDWKLPPVSIELKEGTKPYHGRPYPIPKVHKATLMKEIDRLIAIGVLTA